MRRRVSDIFGPRPGTGPAPAGLTPAGVGVMAVASLAYLLLLSVTPMIALTHYIVDDRLFLRLAESIADGHWLGAYTNLTLVKGAGYPLWLAAIYKLGLPLNVAQGAVWTLAVWLFAGGLVRLRVRPWAAVIVFLFVLWLPGMFETVTGRVLREGLYTPLIGLSAALLVWQFALRNRSAARQIAWGLAQGLVVGWLWITREESITLAPGLAFAALFLLAPTLVEARHRRRRAVVRRFLAVGTGVLAACAVIFGVAAVNKRHYGVLEVSEVKQSPFIAAYGAIARAQTDSSGRYVVVAPATREKLYAVSPAFAELKAYLEGPGIAWANLSCLGLNVQLHPCDGRYRVGHFLWALRDAVAAAGHYTTAGEARGFYKELARQINAACDDGRLNCLSARHTLAPPFRWAYVGRSLVDAWRTLRLALGSATLPPRVRYSENEHEGLDWFRRMTNTAIYPLRGSTVVVLRVAGADARNVTVSVDPLDARQARPVFAARIARRPGDLPDTQRFGVATDCPPSACAVTVAADDGTRLRLPLAGLTAQTQRDAAGLSATVLDVREMIYDTAIEGNARLLRRLLPQWRAFYDYALPAALALGGILYLVSLWFALRRRHFAALPMLATVILVLFGARLGLLAYMNVTSYSIVTYYYLSPLFPLGAMFAVLAASGAWLELRGNASAAREETMHG